MGGGNGAKAAQARARKAEKNPAKGAGSQLKANEKAKNIICRVCKQPFFTTTRPPALEEHSKNKHSMSMGECFPGALG